MFKQFKNDLDILKTDIKAKIGSNEKKIKEILKLENKTFLNFVRVYQTQEEDLEILFSELSHLNSVNNSQKTQKIYGEILPLITQYSSKLSQNENLYKNFKEIKKNELSALSTSQKKVLNDMIESFELSGVGLKPKIKKRIEEINLKLSDLSNQFSQNLIDSTNNWEMILKAKDVKGIAKNDLENAKFEKNGKIRYKFTLQMPSYICYITYGQNRKLREKIYKAYNTRGSKNSKLIDEILGLRLELANLLGFENYAQLSIKTKMANSTDEVIDFLTTLAKKAKKYAKNDLDEVKKLAFEMDKITNLKYYDIPYYSEKLRIKKYNIDEEAYRKYFEQKSVINGLFKFLEKEFGVEFKQIKMKLWDKKALAYDLIEDSKVIARLYLDLEARDSKRGGAWMHNLQSHSFDEKNNQKLASAFVVCNFPKSTKKIPSLLRHDDVVTLFHEMGHAIHHLFSKVDENFVSGVNGVQWDAVEFPSQFLENFAYESEVLKMFAKHYKSGKTISDKMINRLKKAKNFQSSLMMVRQLEFSLFDFKLHLKLYQKKEVQKLLDLVREEVNVIIPPKYNKFQNSFAHIFAGGYSAGYYSYKWAEVLSADAFVSIKKGGIIDKKLIKKYKEEILEKGGSEDMKKLFYNFLQRDYDVDSLLKINGIFSD